MMNPFDLVDTILRRLRESTPEQAAQVFAAWNGTKASFADAVYRRVLKNPVLLRYYRHKTSGETSAGSPQDDQPWMVIGQKLYALAVLLKPEDSGLLVNGRVDNDASIGTALSLLIAQNYLWTNHVDRESRSCELPSCIVSKEVMPYPVMFLCNQTGYTISGPHIVGGDGSATLDWMLIRHWSDRMIVTAYYAVGRSPHLYEGVIFYNRRWPDEHEPKEYTSASGSILRMLAFINSPYIDVQKHKMTRQMRRSAEREAKGEVVDCLNDDVGVVLLRQPKRDPNESRCAEAVDWKHHWWVRGHYRAQWMPSSKSHRVTWIGPHIKGPLDKPLLEKVYAVVR